MEVAATKISHAAFMLANRAGVNTTGIYVDEGAQVAPGLFIGSLATAMDPVVLQKHGITHIVNLSGSDYLSTRPCVKIVMNDAEVTPQNIRQYMKLFIDGAAYVTAARASGHTVLVHCAAGINRSATLIGFHLINSGYTYDDVIVALTRANSLRRTQILTNESFRQMLRAVYSVKKYGSRVDRVDRTKLPAPEQVRPTNIRT